MNELPLITVTILSYNRKNDLENTIKQVFSQSYKNIEVIVVDNASCDGTISMVENLFPNVNLIQLDNNIGIDGYNKGFKAAKGKYILVLDDDSYPGYNTLYEGLQEIEKNNSTGIVAFNIRNTFLDKSETFYFDKYAKTFIGCGALLRKEMLDKIGGYDNDIFIYHNELDLSIRALNNGYNIIYLENSIIKHQFTQKARFSKTNNLLTTKFRYRNFYWSYFVFIRKNLSDVLFIRMLFKLILNRFLIALFYLYVNEFFTISYRIIKNYQKINTKKVIAAKGIQKKYKDVIVIIDRDYFKKQIKLIRRFLNVSSNFV